MATLYRFDLSVNEAGTSDVIAGVPILYKEDKMAKIHNFTHNRHDEDETEVVVYYTYHPGYPQRGPTYACGGEPAEPPEVEIMKATVDGVVIEPTGAELDAWEAYALENYEGGPDLDYLRDLRAEREWRRDHG
jgi:hypothetical protein